MSFSETSITYLLYVTSDGGEINTPTLDRVSKMGISFNRFHSTAMSISQHSYRTNVKTQLFK
ncbi:MAG: hypothetical protein K9M08_14920 [Pirellula sp.]|nr:hypothetical protein [Pirellula sp.]